MKTNLPEEVLVLRFFESGPIDDCDDTFINGTLIGSGWEPGDFAKVRHVKPEASRADSAEMYVVGTGFRG